MPRGVGYDSLAALVDYLTKEEEDRQVPLSALADAARQGIGQGVVDPAVDFLGAGGAKIGKMAQATPAGIGAMVSEDIPALLDMASPLMGSSTQRQAAGRETGAKVRGAISGLADLVAKEGPMEVATRGLRAAGEGINQQIDERGFAAFTGPEDLVPGSKILAALGMAVPAMRMGKGAAKVKAARSTEALPEMPEVSKEKKEAIATKALKEGGAVSDPFAFPAKEIAAVGPIRQQAWPKGSGEGGQLRVLSLFDGLGGGRIALGNLDAPVEYLASEIDPYAIKVHKANYPDTKHIGDVENISGQEVGPVDLLVGGSPCQDLSRAKKGGLGLKGSKSKLFYEYVRLLEETNPRYFVFENVASMKPEVRDHISEIFGVKPIMIDASDVSAQNRKRYFWTNIPVDLPKGNDIKIQDVLEKEVDPKYFHSDKAVEYMNRRVSDGRTHLDFGHHTDARTQEKSRTLTASLRKGVPYNVVIDESGRMRKFTPTEVERLAGVPEGYTEGVSNTQRYKMLGNGFQIQVMEHILSGIPKAAKATTPPATQTLLTQQLEQE